MFLCTARAISLFYFSNVLSDCIANKRDWKIYACSNSLNVRDAINFYTKLFEKAEIDQYVLTIVRFSSNRRKPLTNL